MLSFNRNKVRELQDKLGKALAERDTARIQRDKQKALANARRARVETLEKSHADLVAALQRPAEPPRQMSQPPPPITVPPGNPWPIAEPPWFFADNLAIWAKHAAFADEPRFKRAYQRGMQSGHHMVRPKGSDADIHLEWRTHVTLWAAQRGAMLEGDFVECGVNTGVYSLAICDHLDFNSLDKNFWLFDTYCGIPEEQMSPAEKSVERVAMSAMYYSECFELAKTNFSPWSRAHLVRGMVPDSLLQVEIGKVAYLSLDLNIALPEIAAIEHFWPKLVVGACVVLDDYGWGRHEAQRDAMDAFAARVGVPVLSLPTGQGLMIKAETTAG